uniref:Uncharacterized protein n=1 Tax=Timema cristinae TaxID=61476 RepID=A0A7R9CV01_TIMCR|nr:unnamed protein product [Timema cristinae]
METCDISLVKQEIVERIKTEPQNEDEFDTCGQLEMKTEDDSETSNSIDEIVKTEIKLYDSSFGIIDSNINHFTPVDRSEIKLEQDQSILSKLRQEDIVLNIEIEDNVKSEIVPNGIRLKAIVLNMLV